MLRSYQVPLGMGARKRFQDTQVIVRINLWLIIDVTDSLKAMSSYFALSCLWIFSSFAPYVFKNAVYPPQDYRIGN